MENVYKMHLPQDHFNSQCQFASFHDVNCLSRITSVVCVLQHCWDFYTSEDGHHYNKSPTSFQSQQEQAVVEEDIPKTCSYKKILILLLWQVPFDLPRRVLASTAYVLTSNSSYMPYIYVASRSGSHVLAPFIGWLADVKLGRYEVIIHSILASFFASIIFAVVLITGNIFAEVFSCIGNVYSAWTASVL